MKLAKSCKFVPRNLILLRIKTAKNVIFFHKTILLENILMQLPLSPSLPMCLLALKKT